MPIRPPALDDRNFDDLVEELLARIPAHTPEWTNPRPGDPGRTLIELFAWLTDTLLYRVNLIPERQRLAFLALLGIPLRPALAARTVVTLALPREDATDAIYLRAGAALKGPLPFETLAETTVLPVSAEVYAKRALLPAERKPDTERLIDGLRGIYGLRAAARPYVTTPVFANGQAEAEGFDLSARTVDRSLWIALLAPKAPQPGQQTARNDAVRGLLGRNPGGGPQLLSIGVAPLVAVPALFEEVGPRARIPHRWEASFINDQGLPDLITLQVVSDTSAGLTRNGVLRLALPAQRFLQAPSNDVATNLRAGVGDAPPRLDAADKAARLLGWIRLSAQSEGGVPARIALSWLGVNAVEVEQRVSAEPRVVGVSNGAADQTMQLAAASVEAETLELEVEESGRGYQRWQRVEDLLALGADATRARDARAFVLDSEAGTVRFGDGVRGRIPEPGMRVRARRLRAGGGRAGNLPAGSLREASGFDQGNARVALKVRQPLPGTGGEDAEDIGRAEQRIPAFLRHRERAVTADDYRSLARETPGTDIGRIELLPRFKPHQRRPDVPGVVSVMVLPQAAGFAAPNPRPDRPLIEAVHAWLDARRPLATELYVIGCEYVPLALGAAVTLRDGFGQDTVLNEVRQALLQLLWPLAPGGLDGSGWPLGRAVRDRELEVAVARVPGVAAVSGIRIFERAEGRWRALPRPNDCAPQQLTLEQWQLPELREVLVAAGDESALPDPGAVREDDGASGIPVPLVPEVC